MKPLKIIIDTDPGVDDAMAILFAHASPEIELVGLTTVFGNVWVEQATRNAGHLLDVLKAEYPIAEGAGQPLRIMDFSPASNVHGAEGFGDYVDVATDRTPVEEPAAEFLVRTVRENPGEVTICAVSPLTNIAGAIRLDPDFVSNVGRIVIMGGAVDVRGNITRYAEANIYHDPHAAAEVLSSDAPITLVGLDVTLQTLCERFEFEELAKSAPEAGGFLLKISQFYMEFYRKVAKTEGCAMHDVTAVIAAIHPDLFTLDRTGIAVVLDGDEMGDTVRARREPEIDVCIGIEAEAVKSLFFGALERLN